MNDINWDDLRVFYHVAEAGGLSGAVVPTGLSAPTLGRRILALEHQTGQSLFVRSQTGYRLTPTGAALLQRVRAMHATIGPVRDVLSSETTLPVIRISAGTGTTRFLADNFPALSSPADRFRLSFVTTETTLDIAHREVELGIRNRPAESGNLASRKLAVLRFAPYRSSHIGPDQHLDWVALSPEHARHPAAHWVLNQGHAIRAMANSVSTVHQLVRSGAGIGVMPCLVGDSDARLTRAGPIVEDLTETQYLVMHDDDRHRPPQRRVVDRIVSLYRDHAALLGGDRPMRYAETNA